MESQSETTQTVSALKLPVLKTRDYDLWSMRMEQYLTHTDYALWEVIVNGDAPAIASASTGTEESKMQRPYGKQSRLGLEATKNKKMQKTILKQQYKNFVASRSEGLDKTYDSPQLDNEDLEQIDTDDLEEMNLKWQKLLALIRQRLNVTTATGEFTIPIECRALRNHGIRNRECSKRVADPRLYKCLGCQDGIKVVYDWSFLAEEGITNIALMANTISSLSSSSSYQMGLESLEARIVVHEKNEAVYEEDIAFLSEGFHVVPSPYTRNYMPSRPNLSFAGLDDSVYKTKVSKTETSISKTSKDNLEKPKIVRPSVPIIEDWDTDSGNDSVFRTETDQTKPKDNRRNWNGLMTQKLANGFESIKKACFVCGSFNHLIKDCDFHDKKMVEKPVLNNKGRVTGQKEIRSVWNNAQRVNHQNKFTHPHPKRNFVPTAVVIKSGQIPVNTAKQTSLRATTSISTARPVNTAAPKPKVNDALPITYSYFKAHSPVKRAFNQKSAAKTNRFNEKVNITRVNNVTTAGPKAVVSAAVGNRENAVKSSSC
ncbi:hypothetical protein Tco_1284121 [Tanacetum coccineum]